MKSNTRQSGLRADNRKRLTALILILSAGACALRFLLNFIYDTLLINLGSYSIPVVILQYANEAFSFCALFALMCLAIYALLIGQRDLFNLAVIVQSVSHLLILTVGYCFFVYLLAYIESSSTVRPVNFELSNFTLAELDSGGLLSLLTMAFLSFLVTVLFIVISVPFILGIRKKYIQGRTDLSHEALVGRRFSESPLRKPCTAFLISFAACSLAFQIYGTVSSVITETPVSIGDYLVLAMPYFMIVIYSAAGLLIMQLTALLLSKFLKTK